MKKNKREKWNKNIELILKFHQAWESIKLVNEMAYGTPIFAQIKKQIQDIQTKLEGTNTNGN